MGAGQSMPAFDGAGHPAPNSIPFVPNADTSEKGFDFLNAVWRKEEGFSMQKLVVHLGAQGLQVAQSDAVTERVKEELVAHAEAITKLISNPAVAGVAALGVLGAVAAFAAASQAEPEDEKQRKMLREELKLHDVDKIGLEAAEMFLDVMGYVKEMEENSDTKDLSDKLVRYDENFTKKIGVLKGWLEEGGIKNENGIKKYFVWKQCAAYQLELRYLAKHFGVDNKVGKTFDLRKVRAQQMLEHHDKYMALRAAKVEVSTGEMREEISTTDDGFGQFLGYQYYLKDNLTGQSLWVGGTTRNKTGEGKLVEEQKKAYIKYIGARELMVLAGFSGMQNLQLGDAASAATAAST